MSGNDFSAFVTSLNPPQAQLRSKGYKQLGPEDEYGVTTWQKPDGSIVQLNFHKEPGWALPFKALVSAGVGAGFGALGASALGGTLSGTAGSEALAGAAGTDALGAEGAGALALGSDGIPALVTAPALAGPGLSDAALAALGVGGAGAAIGSELVNMAAPNPNPTNSENPANAESSGGDWLSSLKSAAPSLISAGGNVLGSVLGANANKDAAQTAADANAAAAKAANDAIDKQIAAMRQGLAEGDQYYGQAREQAQPGVDYLRSVIAAPASLTPEQRAEREDLIRRVTNSSQVAGSALRGSGRSFVDAMRAIEGDFTNKALASNKARADSAASQFTSPYFNSFGNQAGAHSSLGTQVGGAIANQGANLGNSLTATGQVNADATAANGSLWGSTIGQVGSEIASQLKNDATKKAAYDPATGNYTPGPGGF